MSDSVNKKHGTKGTVDYILNQEKHHKKRSFAQEWKIFLKRHGLVDYQE